MRLGIAGLGLIGGSLAKAYKLNSSSTVYGYDIADGVVDIAQIAEAIDGELTNENIASCDLLLIALYPKDAIEYLEKVAPFISPGTFVIDCCGIKRDVCSRGFELARQFGFTFVGGHPMAGTQFSGFKHSKATLFKGASMIVVPPVFDDMALLEKIKEILDPVGFGRISVTTPEKHDETIAFTSQMAHLVSNAYIKSPTAQTHKGFSAGSYKDLTRVAWLNEEMWTQLFLENGDNLIKELDFLMNSLEQYRSALAASDSDALKKLLAEGRKCKEAVDGDIKH
ncbi:MAG: prephenate dehydrogenase [Oscillospiraceae bacterium]|nr:prephenate dehydrogenase [Oscillospiraceae bacterium]